MPFTLRNLREDLADVGPNFDGGRTWRSVSRVPGARSASCPAQRERHSLGRGSSVVAGPGLGRLLEPHRVLPERLVRGEPAPQRAGGVDPLEHPQGQLGLGRELGFLGDPRGRGPSGPRSARRWLGARDWLP